MSDDSILGWVVHQDGLPRDDGTIDWQPEGRLPLRHEGPDDARRAWWRRLRNAGVDPASRNLIELPDGYELDAHPADRPPELAGIRTRIRWIAP